MCEEDSSQSGINFGIYLLLYINLENCLIFCFSFFLSFFLYCHSDQKKLIVTKYGNVSLAYIWQLGYSICLPYLSTKCFPSQPARKKFEWKIRPGAKKN